MIELGNPPPRPPEVWKATGIATGDFTTRSPARSPARSSTAASPGKIPPCGAETTVVNPALRQVSMRLSLRLTSSAALRHAVDACRVSGPPPPLVVRLRPPYPPTEWKLGCIKLR